MLTHGNPNVKSDWCNTKKLHIIEEQLFGLSTSERIGNFIRVRPRSARNFPAGKGLCSRTESW